MKQTGWMGAYALEHKSLVDEAFKEHVMLLRMQHEAKMQRLQSENAREYKGMQPLLRDLGIQWDPTHPTTRRAKRHRRAHDAHDDGEASRNYVRKWASGSILTRSTARSREEH
mmetsp:Transcript_8303/g.37090  ORF Transcript_8303/g.37090 Transcript_8303/m.37090 type:complete len:113 (-) Transcript_8303:2967-3305(-)